jgi:hypothetical protein
MTDTQYEYRRNVEALLEQIRRRVAELQRLRARGLRGEAVRELKQDLRRTREQLAAVVNGNGLHLANR